MIRRFFCRAVTRKDFDRLKAGQDLILGYRTSEETDPEQRIREAFEAEAKLCCPWEGLEIDVILDELPFEEAVTPERILAEPAIVQDCSFDVRDWSRIFTHFMEEVTWSWHMQRDMLDENNLLFEKDSPLTIVRRLRLDGRCRHFRGFSLHLSGAPFAVVLEVVPEKESPDVEVFILDDDLAAQAAEIILKARMAAVAAEIAKGLQKTRKADPKAPIITFDDELVAFFDGKIQHDKRP